MRLELRSETAEDTRALGEALAGVLEPRDAVALTGELGAGKTTLVQGVARGLGFAGTVTSPTFTLVREYHGRLDVAHVDVYRLDRVQDVIDLGLEEIAEGDAVLLVEWGDSVDALLPRDHLTIELTAPDPGSETRRIVLEADGPAWASRWERLRDLLERWRTAA
jgi:tRNA threonylcarbamoyladenosine biosynthesis protein TsaE